jgi:hypothetical protein
MDLNQKLDDLEFTPDEQVWPAIENETRKKARGIYDMTIMPPEICWTNIAEQISNVEKKNTKPKSISDFSKWIRYAAIFIGITLGTISLLDHSIRNKLLNTVLESNLKTSLSDTQHILPINIKKTDTSTKNSFHQSTLEKKK